MDFIQFQHALAQATKQTFYEWNPRNDGLSPETCRIYEILTARKLLKQKLDSITFSHVLELRELGDGGEGNYERTLTVTEGRSNSSTISHKVTTKLTGKAKWTVPLVGSGDISTTAQYDFSSVTAATDSYDKTTTTTLSLDASVDNYAYAKKITICYQDSSCEYVVGGLAVSHDEVP